MPPSPHTLSSLSHSLSHRADSNAPTWFNNLDGQVNVRDALRRTISYTAPGGKTYQVRRAAAAVLARAA